MMFEMTPCTEDEAKFIEEQAEKAFRAIAPPAPDAEEEEIHYKITDGEGNVIGGCTLETDEWETASLSRLWVDEPYRRQGIASALIQETEREARARGCYLMMLGTFDWQAKPLYEKHGYTLIEATPDWPKGHTHYFFAKRLDREIRGYIPHKPCAYEIKRGDEETAKTLSARFRQFDEAVAPREHAYIPIGRKVMNEDGRIIAGITGGLDGWNYMDLEAIWVDEPYRGKGIGSDLLRAFEQEAKKNGADRMMIEPFDRNVSFFRKNGYEKVTSVLEDFPQGHTMYCMEKPL
jgi:GNAT superfamily N-acetyltransferase